MLTLKDQRQTHIRYLKDLHGLLAFKLKVHHRLIITIRGIIKFDKREMIYTF